MKCNLYSIYIYYCKQQIKTSFNKSKFLLDTLRVYGTVRISKTGEWFLYSNSKNLPIPSAPTPELSTVASSTDDSTANCQLFPSSDLSRPLGCINIDTEFRPKYILHQFVIYRVFRSRKAQLLWSGKLLDLRKRSNLNVP